MYGGSEGGVSETPGGRRKMSVEEVVLALVGYGVAVCTAGLGACAWPLGLILIVLLLRRHVPLALSRLKEVTFPGGKMTMLGYGSASVDEERGPVVVGEELEVPAETEAEGLEAQPEAEPSEDERIRWENSGNLFWLGRDLMWTLDVLLRGAPGDQIRHGLRQSLHHVRSMGFAKSPYGARIEGQLEALAVRAEQTREWTATDRDVLAKQLFSLTSRIGAMAAGNQTDYEPR
jgi:hypothetical protein